MPTLTQSIELSVDLGTIKQFGPFGPEYEVMEEVQPRDGKRMVKIVLVRTGEEVDYPLEAVLLDPEAA